MAARVSVVVVELVGYETGLWCRSCALSTGIAMTVMTTSVAGGGLSTARRCAECGGDDVVLA